MAVSPRPAYSLRPGRVRPSGTGRPGGDSFIPDGEVVSRFACPSVARPAARLSASQLRALAPRQAPGGRARSRLHLPQAFRARRRFAPALDSQHQPARCRAAWGQAFGVGLWTSQSPTQRPGRRPRRVVCLSGRQSSFLHPPARSRLRARRCDPSPEWHPGWFALGRRPGDPFEVSGCLPEPRRTCPPFAFGRGAVD